MQDYYAVGYKLKEWVRRSIRQILLAMLLCAAIAYPFVADAVHERKIMQLATYGRELTDPWEAPLTAFGLGIFFGPFLWLLVKFVAFVVGPRLWSRIWSR